MKKQFLILITLLASLCLYGKTSIPAADSKITYIGRTEIRKGSVSFDWSGVTARIRFNGTSLSLKASDTHRNYFNIWIDTPAGVKEQKVITTEGQGEIVLAEGLSSGEHEVILQKRTEGEQGTVTFSEFTTDGSFLSAGSPRGRLIEFIGDSYTCGYGTEALSRDEPFKAETENCNLTYAAILGRTFDADIRLVSHSGRGISRNYDGFKATPMSGRYSETFDMQEGHPWKPSGKTPDIVIIYLGTNDFSTGMQPSFEAWKDAFKMLTGKIREFYGKSVPVLMVAAKASPMLGEYVEKVVEGCGDPNIHWTSIQDKVHNDTTELGASWHPNYKGHRKVACCMLPYVSTLTGWEFPVKAIE